MKSPLLNAKERKVYYYQLTLFNRLEGHRNARKSVNSLTLKPRGKDRKGLDGHNRYGLCTKHDLPFRVEAREFESRNDVCIWMIQNQFGRRNLDNYVKGSLSLRLEDYFKLKGLENKKVGGKLGADITNESRDLQKSAKAEIKKVDTREELVKIAGVSHDTIYKVKEIKSLTPPEILSELENVTY